MDFQRVKKGYFLLNNKKYITRAGVNLIGRNREAAVIMKNASVSQHHALLVILDDDKHYLSDLNSSNGTILDSAKLEPLCLYEIKQGASVQFADVRSTYFKATDNTEVNTQESEPSQIVNDTLFNAETQLFNGSIISVQPTKKLKEISHISDHGYTKLLGDHESFLNAASTSAGGDTSNSGVARRTEEGVQESSPVNHMNDHGYYKKIQKEDIHDVPTQVKSINVKTSLAETIHDAPTQVTNTNIKIGLAEPIHDATTQHTNTNIKISLTHDAPIPTKCNNIRSSLAEAINDLPTQIIDGFDKDDAQVQNTSIHELPTQMIQVPDVLDMFNLKDVKASEGDEQVINKPSTSSVHKFIGISTLEDVEGGSSKEQVTQKSCTLEKYEQTPDPPPVIDESVLEAKCNNSNDVIDETLPDNFQQEQNPASTDENSTDSIDFITMQSATQHFTDHTPSEDLDAQSMLHVSQQNRKVRYMIESDDETDVESEPDLIRTNKVKRTKKKNVIDSSQETEAELEDDKVGKIRDSDSETDVEIDVSKDEKDKKEPALNNDKKVSAEFESKHKDDGSTKTTKARPIIEDSDSDTDVEIDISKAHGEGRPRLNDVSLDKKPNEEFDYDGSTKAVKARPILESSDSETDDEIDVSNDGKVGESKETKPCSKDRVKARAIIEDSDSETDVEIDVAKASDVGKSKSLTNELNNDKRANEGFSETKINLGGDQNDNNEIDSDSDLKLIKANKKKYVFESSDDTDVEEEMSKSTKETPTNQANNEENNSRPQSTRIDEGKEDENKKDSDELNSNSRLDDTDVIPATQNSFVGEIDFDFNTQDLNYAAAKLEKARKEKITDDTLNSERSLGDSFKLALTNSSVEAKHDDENSTIDLFLQATQKTADGEETISRNKENESVFVKPTQKLGSVTHGDGYDEDDEDEIFIQPTQQLSVNQGLSEEISLQPQIIVSEAKSKDDSLFIKPTQKLASVEEKLESIFRPTQPDDDGIFLEATQKLPEKEERGDEVTFLKPAQVLHKTKLTSKPNPVEDSIFAQATQVLSEEAKTESKSEDDDDIFMQATQISPEVQNDNKEKEEDGDIFVQPTQVTVDDELKESHPPGHSVESQLEVMFASQNVRLIEDENHRPENPLLNLLSSLETHSEIIEINDELPEESSNKKIETSAGPSKKKSRAKTTHSDDDDAETNKPKRSNRKSPLLRSEVETTKRSTSIANKIEEECDVPKVLSEEEKIDLLFRTSGIMQDDLFLESTEPVGRNRRSPQPIRKKTETHKGNESSKSLRCKKSVATVEEQPELPSKLEDISIPLENKVQLEEEDKLQSNKRNVKSTKRAADNSGGGTSSDDVGSEEEKIDLLFKTSGIMQDDLFLESTEPVGRTRRSPQPVRKKTETHKGNESSKSLRSKTSLATVEEQLELPSKLEDISTPLENKVQLEEEGKLQSKKGNVKSTKRDADNSEGGTSSDNVGNEEETIDLLFKTSGIMQDAIFLECTEPVGRTRRSSQPVRKKTETHKGNESSKSLRSKTSLATVEEQPELPSKLEEDISIPLENKVQLDEEGKLQSKKRNVKSTKRAADNSGGGTSSDNVGNESSKSLRSKASLATLEKQPESLSKLNEISIPLENEVSAAGQQPEEGRKLQSKKRTVKTTKIEIDNPGEGTSSDNTETIVKPERSRRQRANKGEEIIEDIGSCKEDKTSILETPHRSTKRTRNNNNNNNIEAMHMSDNSNDFEVPLRSDLPSTSKRTTKASAAKLKDREEVAEERTPSSKGKIKSKLETDQKHDVKEKKQRTKRTNSTANEEIEEKTVKNVKRSRLNSTENESTNNNTPGPLALGNETPSTSRSTRAKRTQNSAAIEEENIKPGADATSDDEFAPAASKKKRKNVLDSDSEDITSQSSVSKSVPATPTRRKLLQLPDNSLSTPERLKRKLKPKVVFTMLDSPELESAIRSLGGSVVDSVEASTVLVTSGVKRSQKLLSAVGLGKPICSPKWLQECRKAGNFLDPWDHILVDDEAENKWRFSLKESLQRSVESKLLENYIVHLIVNNAQDVLKGAIESCGGKCVTRAPPKNSTANYIIVASPENKSKYARFLKQVPQPMVVAPEAIFDGVLRQELHFEDHRLT